MKRILAVLVFLILISPVFAANDRVRRDELDIDSVRCGLDGQLFRGQLNDCFVRIRTREDLRDAKLVFRIVESGLTFQSGIFQVERRDSLDRPDLRDFDRGYSQFVYFWIPPDHPPGAYLLEVRLFSGSIRPPSTFRFFPLLSKGTFVPVSVI